MWTGLGPALETAASETRLRSALETAASETRLRSALESAASEARLGSAPASAASEARLRSALVSACGVTFVSETGFAFGSTAVTTPGRGKSAVRTASGLTVGLRGSRVLMLAHPLAHCFVHSLDEFFPGFGFGL